MSLERDLDVYLRARTTLIVLVTPEEERALNVVKALCNRTNRPCLTWDIADQFQTLCGEPGPLPAAKEPLVALDQVDKWDDDALFVLKDFHEFWNSGPVKRKLRSVAQRLKTSKKALLITTPTHKLPEELKD